MKTPALEHARRLAIRVFLRMLCRGTSGKSAMREEFARVCGGSRGAVLTRGDDILIACKDHVLWCDRNDQLITAGVLKRGHWQREDFEYVLERLTSSGPIFVDVGANIGTQTIYALVSGRFSRAIAFEPDPRNFDLLSRNMAANGLSHQVTLVNAAVSRQTGEAILLRDPSLQGMHRIVEDHGANTVSVPTVSLDDALASAGIGPQDVGLIWIDVEGHECEVFQSMCNLLDARVPVMFEYSRHAVSEDQRNDWLRIMKHRYSRFAIMGHGECGAASPDDAFSRDFTNILATP